MAHNPDLRQVVIHRAGSLPQAQLLCNLLEDAGIDAVVVNDTMQALIGAVPSGWTSLPCVVVARSDEARARNLAQDFDLVAAPAPDADDPDSTAFVSQKSLPLWPACPECNRVRTAVCPVCATSGVDFPLAWGDSSVGTVELNVATARLAANHSESGLLLICPSCDESFRPGFLNRCEWCGHAFHEGVKSDVEPPEPVSVRIFATLVALIVVMAAILGYFAFILR